MQYRQLGDSGIEVSAICLGSWLTYGVGVDDSAGRACVDASLDAGINFIDTANIYGRGAAESFLGDALKGQPRPEERRGGKAWVSTCSSRWSPQHTIKTNITVIP